MKITLDSQAHPARREAPHSSATEIAEDRRNAPHRPLITDLPLEKSDVGDPNGSNWGASERAVGDQYLAEISAALRENYLLPAGLAPDLISSPPEISFRFGDDGTISDVELTKSSANPLVDDACLNAARMTRRVPVPPSGFRKRGISVVCEK